MILTGQYGECQRAYLGEPMPVPELPHSMQLLVRILF